jgi:uncharacterized protein YaiL (DUF2058 family)
MSDSLRDQLLKAGFAPPPKTEPRPKPARPPQGRPGTQQRPHKSGAPRQQQKPRPQGDIDLAKAYALRDRNEREQHEREQRLAEQRARERKEPRQKLCELLNDKALNDAAAEIPRHFPHANKIRRIYVTAAQLPLLNGGELAVVQLAGRYLLVTRETGLAKWFATVASEKAASDAVQIHGANGYSDEYPVGRFFRNCKAAVIYEGTREIHKLMQADYLLGYRTDRPTRCELPPYTGEMKG